MFDNIKAAVRDLADYKEKPELSEKAQALYDRLTAYGEQHHTQEQSIATEANPELPDPAISLSERDLYGYPHEDVLPLLKDRALELYDQDHTIYLLYPDGSESMAFERAEIEQHNGIFGIGKEEWKAALDFQQTKDRVRNSEASKEADLMYGAGDKYGIYQIEDTRNVDYAFRPLSDAGNGFSRADYKLMYVAPLEPGQTLESIYVKHNRDDRPAGQEMRSLSMSDVIVLKQNSKLTAHYLDRGGYAPVPQFLEKESHIKAAEMSTEQNYNMIDGTPNNHAPTVAELEANVQAGKQISLLDLANAIKNENKANSSGKKPSLLGQLERNKAAVAQKNKNPSAQKDAPPRKPGNLEVD